MRDDEEQWRMLRLRTGETVYFGAPDTLPETVAVRLDGTKPWPEIRAMELSIAARRALSVPRARRDPWCPKFPRSGQGGVKGCREDAAAAADFEGWRRHGAPQRERRGKAGAGSTATPQQANIIEQLVNATGAVK